MVDTGYVAGQLIERITSSRDLRSSIQYDRYRILTDDFEEYIHHRINERFRQGTQAAYELKYKFLDQSANVYKYIVGLLSVVYKEPPARSFALKKDSKLWDQVVDVNDLDVAMERVNQITTACNECFVHPTVRDGMLDFDIVLPHSAEVWNDGRHLKAIIFPALMPGTNEEIYEYWDDEYRIAYDKSKNPVGGLVEHGYGMVPFATYRRARPATGFWLGKDGEDLVKAFDDQVIGRSWVNRISYVQSYTQVFREQDEAMGDGVGITAVNPTFGPDSIPTGKYRTLDLRTDVRAQLEVLERKLQRTAANWGVSSDALTQAKHTSGLERLLSFAGLMEYRKKTIKHFRPVDKRLMKIACRVWNTDGGGEKFSSNAEPRIDYAEPQLVESQLDRVTLQEKEESLGVKSSVDYLMTQNPDLKDRAEAMSIIKRNLKEQQVVQEHKRSFQVPANQDVEQRTADGETGGRPERDEPREVTAELEEKDNGDG